MKKIISLFLAAIMCIGFSVVAAAEDKVISFPMTTTTGTVVLKSSNKASTSFVPTIAANDSIVLGENDVIPEITSVTLKIEGEKYGMAYISNAEYPFMNYYDEACTRKADKTGDGAYWKLNLNTVTAFNDEFLVTAFSRIYSVGIVATGYFETESEKVYNEWGVVETKTDSVKAFTIVKNFGTANDLTNLITDLINDTKSFTYDTKYVRYDYPFLPTTDVDFDGIVTRNEVDILSYSAFGTGLGIRGFEGLASQVAEFFNHKTNGTITFRVTTAPSVMGTVWSNGGVPSTQTGLFTGTKLNNIMGLFFNYDTTGSLVATSQIAPDGTITFDISDILDAVGGNTLASLRNIYYGLIGGIGYTTEPIKGVKIDQVILSYKDEAPVIIEPVVTTVTTTAPETTIETTTEEEEIPLDCLDDEDEIVVEDDEDDDTVDAEIIADEDTDVSNDNDVLIDEDDDVNPGTGTALALIPVIICASVGAVATTFKKRK